MYQFLTLYHNSFLGVYAENVMLCRMNSKTFAAAVAAIDKVTLDRDVLYVCIVGRNEDFVEDSVYALAAMVKKCISI